MKRNTLRMAVLPLVLVLGLSACQGQNSDDDQAATPTAAVTGDGVALQPRESITATVTESTEEPTSSDPGSGTSVIDSLTVGDCFNIPEDQTTTSGDSEQVAGVDVVDCAGEHVYEVFGEGNITAQNLPSDEELQTQTTEICDPQFAPYVGTDPTSSKFGNYNYFYPTALSWAAGDRRVVCILALADQSPTTGSARGSGQ